jgi:hypothetical protein
LASIDRTAYPRFKRVVSARELAEAFAPTPDEAGWARGRTQNDQHRRGWGFEEHRNENQR